MSKNCKIAFDSLHWTPNAFCYHRNQFCAPRVADGHLEWASRKGSSPKKIFLKSFQECVNKAAASPKVTISKEQHTRMCMFSAVC